MITKSIVPESFKSKILTNLQKGDIDYAGYLLGQKYISDACSYSELYSVSVIL